jgi:hypothetical protein
VTTNGVPFDRAELLRQEIERATLVLSGASFEEFERAVQAITEAVGGLPDVLPEWRPRIFKITTDTSAARASNPKAGNPGLLPPLAFTPGA